MNKTDKQTLFKASLLAGLLAAGLNVQAAGLGKLVVYSAIGQPLNAEVAITATPEELGSLAAKLASHDAFKDAGIEFMPALTGLRFNIVKTTGALPVLKITTERPLSEPFLHFLIELNWTAGRMRREYTFLLDPPEMLQVSKPASVVAPVIPSGRPVEPASVKPAPVKAAPLPLPVRIDLTTPAASATASEYRVKAGDTLGKIARESRTDAVTLDQMLVALFNSNRDAFDGNNMNRLRAGKILRVPDAAEVAALSQGEARKLVIGQATDFNAYKRRLAEVVVAAPATPVTPAQQVTGKIAPKVEEKTSAAPPSDKLQVSRSEASKTAAAEAGRKILEEDLIARDKALREANTRIVELEKNLENLRKLVELKSGPAAQIQQQAEASTPPKPADDKKPTVAPPVKPIAETTPSQPVHDAKPTSETAPAPVPSATPVAEKPAAPPPAETPAPKPEAKKPALPPPSPPEPDFIEENPGLVFGGGALLALLAGYFGFVAWRKKKQAHEPFPDTPSVSERDVASKSGAVFGTASESVGSNEVSIQGDFSESGVLTTEESVDPVAEADVLMAYGRDGQAEEILLEGIKADPTREAIHVKLLELYANRGSASQFETVAKDLHGLNGGRGAEWERATVLAQGLGVTGGLFAGDASASEERAAVAPSAPLSPESASATVIMSAPVPAEAPPAMPEAAADSLEFDLDLGTTSMPQAAPAAEKAAPPPAVEEVASLDFDFDLGSPEAAAAPKAEVEPVAAEAPADEGNAIDFSLDDMGATPPADSEVAPLSAAEGDDGEHHEIDFDIDLGSVPDAGGVVADLPIEAESPAVAADDAGIAFDFDLGDTPAASDEVQKEVADLDMPDLPLASEISDVPEIPAAVGEVDAVVAPMAFDLPDISLDLDEPAVIDPVAEELSLGDIELPAVELPAVDTVAAGADIDLSMDIGEAVPEPAPVGPLPDLETDMSLELVDPSAENLETSTPEAEEAVEVDNPEVATKLELAQAYEEMGDIEGAKELLTEVLSEGSSTQQAAAKAKLDALDT